MTTEAPRMRVSPTTREILQRQTADAERNRAQQKKPVATATKPAVTGTAVAPAKSTAVTVPDTRTPVEAYLDEIAPSSFSGLLTKFNKDGKFVVTSTGDEISESSEFIALCDETLVGWIKFNGEGAQPDRAQGLLYSDFVKPPRETLGDADESQWEIGLNGEPADPWQHQMNLVLQETTTAEIFTFSTTSDTGRRAVGNLLRHYERLRRKDNNLYPVVRLKTGGFQHKDPRVGWVPVPTFVVVGKAPKDTAAKPDTSPKGDLED